MSTKFILIVVAGVYLCYLTLAFNASPVPQGKVEIHPDCAQACPHHDGKKLCARNILTGKLGTFESECIFGRYNSCIKTIQKYEFVKYGECT